jgi:hypothetical protein
MARGTSANDGKPTAPGDAGGKPRDKPRKTTSGRTTNGKTTSGATGKATKGTTTEKAGTVPAKKSANKSANKSAKVTVREPAKTSGKGTTAKAAGKATPKGPTKASGNTSGAKAASRGTSAIRQWNSRRGRAAQLLVRSLATLLLSLCAVEILRLTLTPSPLSVGIAHANLHPFATIRLYLRYGSLRQQALQIGGNAAIGVPLGFLLPQITPRLRGLLRIILVTGVFVTLIELAQWMFVRGRAFDVDDIILAAIGACIGYVPLGRMFGMRLHPDHLHWWQRLLRQGTAGKASLRQGAARERRPGTQGPATAPDGRRRVRSRVHSSAPADRSRRTAGAGAGAGADAGTGAGATVAAQAAEPDN